jgi:cell division protein FtsQ
VTEIEQRVPPALSLDPHATLFSTLTAPPRDEAETPPPLSGVLPRRRRASKQAAYGRRLGIAVFTGLSGALAFSLLTDGGKQTRAVATFLPETQQALQWTGLLVEQVTLTGQRFTADADVFAAIDIPNSGSLVTFDAAAARARIEALPWVQTATISRIYPASLEVRISERRPAALWINNGREYLVDGSGRVLSPLKSGTQVKLPRLSGAGAPEQAQSLIELIVRYPRIAERFEMAERVGGRRWTLHLKDGVVVHLGSDREAVAFAALSAPDGLGKLLTSRNLIVDLRTRGRVTVRPATQETATIQTQS